MSERDPRRHAEERRAGRARGREEAQRALDAALPDPSLERVEAEPATPPANARGAPAPDYGPDVRELAFSRMAGDEAAPPPPPAAAPAPTPAFTQAIGSMGAAPTSPAPQSAMAADLASPWPGQSVAPPPAPPVDRAIALAQPQGIVEPGNIDLHDRPISRNADGSYSTLRSMSFGTPRGETLVPTIGEDGQIMSDEEAQQQFERTGRHLGVFRDVPSADRFADEIHRSGDAEYGDRVRADPTITRTAPISAAPQHEVDQAPGVSQSVDYGAAGQAQMDAWLRSRAAAPAPGDAFARARGLAPGGAAPPAGAKPPIDAARQEAAGPLGRLDIGLPSEADIARARPGAGVEILRRLGNFFRGATGQAPVAASTRADELEAERRSGLRAAMAGKAGERTSERTAAIAAARQAQSDALAQDRLGLEERRTASAEQTAAALTPARVAQMEAQTEHAQAGTAHILTADEVAAAERTGSTDATSDESIAARLGFRTGIGRLPTALRDQIIEESGVDPSSDAYGGMSARQLAVANRMLERISVGTRGGSSGTGAPRDRASLEAAAHEQGITPAEVAASTTRELADLVHRAAAAAPRPGDDGRGVAILPGVYADPEIISGVIAQRGLHDRIVQATQHLGSLERVREIGEEYGRTGALDPRAEADLVGARSSLMAMVAQLENSGIIGPSDMPRILAAVPNAASFTQAELGTLPRRMQSFQTEIDRAARIQLRGAGVTEDGITAALAFMHGGGAAAPRAASDEITEEEYRRLSPEQQAEYEVVGEGG